MSLIEPPESQAHAEALVEIHDVTRSFPGPPEVQALRGVSLTIGRGEFVSVMGPSGSGKSTLLNLLGLLDRPTVGTYRLDGVETTRLAERARAQLRASRIGFVFQAFHLLPHRTVEENVLMGMLYSGIARAARPARARSALTAVGLDHRLSFKPTTLSGGERQRAAIARAIALEPALLIADEPTGNLDSATSSEVLDLFGALNGAGLTVIVVTHDPAVAERAGRHLRLVDGRMAQA